MFSLLEQIGMSLAAKVLSSAASLALSLSFKRFYEWYTYPKPVKVYRKTKSGKKIPVNIDLTKRRIPKHGHGQLVTIISNDEAERKYKERREILKKAFSPLLIGVILVSAGTVLSYSYPFNILPTYDVTTQLSLSMPAVIATLGVFLVYLLLEKIITRS